MCLVSGYENLWFFPDELERENQDDKFLWGKPNWELKDPQEKISKLNAKIEKIKKKKATFKEKMYKYQDN